MEDRDEHCVCWPMHTYEQPQDFAPLSSGAKWVRELEATHFQSSLSSCDPKGLRIHPHTLAYKKIE